MDKDQALDVTAKRTGIGRPSIFSFLKEKLRAGGLRDNKVKFINRLTVYERLSLEEVDKIRHLIHSIFAKFRKTKEPENEEIEVEHPSYGNISLNWPFHGLSKKYFDFELRQFFADL